MCVLTQQKLQSLTETAQNFFTHRLPVLVLCVYYYINSYSLPQLAWGLWVVQRGFCFSLGVLESLGKQPCPKAWIKPGWWVERRVEGRHSEIAEVKRPRLVLGLKMNKASLISEAG